MCSVLGAVFWNITDSSKADLLNSSLRHMMYEGHERGRDGRGYYVNSDVTMWPETHRRVDRVELGEQYGMLESTDFVPPNGGVGVGVFMANLRAEPTTEFVRDKYRFDQQPYCSQPWAIVHNGTIANDKELRDNELATDIDSAAIVERLRQKSEGQEFVYCFETFVETVKELVGSYAIIAAHSDLPNSLFIACNYRPLWYVVTPIGFFIASAEEYLPETGLKATMVKPYTAHSITYNKETGSVSMATERLIDDNVKRALVVCSGGLDSVVAATIAKDAGLDIELIHFQYGSRAEGPEVEAVKAVAERLNVPLRLFPLNIYDPACSPLLQADSSIAGGEAGAEFAHEWVPARNLVMLSVATALAEVGGFGAIILGNNLEEAGAYPDNEPEFINRFNAMLPFATGDGKHVEVIMPVGNLMKHEIVKIGEELNAPLDLTWSCYRAGEKHCGKCGPCFMRKTAFNINGLDEVIEYE